MLSKYWFLKKIYPLFKEELLNVTNNSKAIFLWQNENDILKIIVVIQNELIIFYKEKTKKLIINKIILPNNLSFNNKLTITYEDLKSYVLTMKNDGIIVDSQHMIEFISNNLKNATKYYNLSRQEVVEIFKTIVIDNKIIFQNNPPATVVENLANKWID